MPIGEHRVRCRECGKYFTCGDCIVSTCPECECKVHGHLVVGDFCGRCGKHGVSSKEKCKHESFACTVNVNRLEDIGRFTADVRITCQGCGLPFRFIGLPAGVDINGAAVSVDGCEARLAVAPKGEVVTPLEETTCHGFTVRKVV